jgi:DNA-binding response OmpR family regulator
MKKIVVVDDDQSILEVTKMILENDGYQVESYPNGSFIKKLAQNDTDDLPSLVILDVMLSGEDGRELCKKLKRNEATKNIPVILFSAHAQDELKRDMVNVKCDYFLAKPFDIDTLSSAVNTLTSQQH